MKEIEKNNKLIAKFIGMGNSPKHYNLMMNSSLTVLDRSKTSCTIDELRFHKSWSWLMFVIEKIETLKSPVYIHSNSCTIYEVINFDVSKNHYMIEQVLNTKLESTYYAVVEYIKWYNEQNKSI